MSDNEKDLASPAFGGDELEIETEPTVEPEPMREASSSESAAYDNEYNLMIRHLAAQPKEWVRLSEDTFVMINGWKWTISKGRVQVPQQVAELLVEANRI